MPNRLFQRHGVLAVIAILSLNILGCSMAQTPLQQQGNSSAILLEGFHWDSSNYSNPDWYSILTAKAVDIQTLGVTHVWFPPPSDSLGIQGYLPRQLNLLDSAYGNHAELATAIATFKSLGIQSIVDTVINHRVGTTNWGDFTNPTWNCSAAASPASWSGACGHADTGEQYPAGRDLDHTNPQVQHGIIAWMAMLKNLGFTGIRYDFAIGYRGEIQALYSRAFQPDFCVDEVWTNFSLSQIDAHRQTELNYISGDGTSCSISSDGSCGNGNGRTCGTFDFTTHGLLVEALTNNDYNVLKDAAGRPAGAIGWWPAMQVTFVDNHDTGGAETSSQGQNLWPTPPAAVMQAYAYILTHPGIPMLFYPHVYNWGLRSAILSLVRARQAIGITSTSPVTILAATTGLYAAEISGSKGKISMKIGPNNWSPAGSGWVLATSGNNYAVWTEIE